VRGLQCSVSWRLCSGQAAPHPCSSTAFVRPLNSIVRPPGMLEIDFEPPTESICECCGNTTVRLTRFVLNDGDAFAVYYAQFTKSHSEKALEGLVGLGAWGDDAGPDQRLAFPFRMWIRDENAVVGLVDAAQSPWSESTFLGRLLDRDEALAHPWVKDVFHITDHMLLEDAEIKGHFFPSLN